MSPRGISSAVCLAALTCLAALAPAIAQAGPAVAPKQPVALGQIGWSSTVTLETSSGPVTCGLDPPEEPDWEDLQVLTEWPVFRAEILGASGVECSTSTLGEVEILAGGFPWRLTLDSRTEKGRLAARSGRILLEARLLDLGGAGCTYMSSPLTGAITGEDPLVVDLSIRRIALERRTSLPICPKLAGLSASLTLG